MANILISYVSGVQLHDYGCPLKAYKKEVIKGVKLYGEIVNGMLKYTRIGK